MSGRWPVLAGSVAGLRRCHGLYHMGGVWSRAAAFQSATSSQGPCRSPRRWCSVHCAGCCANAPEWSTYRSEGQFLSAAFRSGRRRQSDVFSPGGHDRCSARRVLPWLRYIAVCFDQLPRQPGGARCRAQPTGCRHHRLPFRRARATTVEQVQLSAPVLEPIPIPGLAKIPFFGRVLFQQNILAYLAAISVVLVLAGALPDRHGVCESGAVGEHPEAADTVGISVRGIRWSAVLAGGLFGG